METVACDLCGESNTKPLYQIEVSDKSLKYYLYAKNIPQKETMTGTFSIVQCKNCSLVYTNPRLTESELALVYSSNRHLGGNWRNWPYLFKLSESDDLQSTRTYDSASMLAVSKWLTWQTDIVDTYREQYLKKPSKETSVLDIGCGTGAFLHRASACGYEVYGCDINPDRLKVAKDIFSLNSVYCGKAEEHFKGRTFDIVTLWDVIEHVASPSKLLEEAKRYLKPNGLVFIYTMSLDSLTYKLMGKKWYYIDPVQHLYYYSDKTLIKTLEKAQLKYRGKELDDSKDYPFRLVRKALKEGITNNLVFKVFRGESFIHTFLQKLFHMRYGAVPRERMLVRLANLAPYILGIRYKDDFIYIGQREKTEGA